MANEDKNEIPKDPITTKSLLWPIFWSTVVLLLATVWAFYDETVTRRPWKQYQRDWIEVGAEAYRAKLPAAEQEDRALRNSEGYLALKEQVREMEASIAEELQTLQDELDQVIAPQLATLEYSLRESKSFANAKKYQVEMAQHHAKEAGDPEQRKQHLAEADRLLNELRAIRERKYALEFGGEKVEWGFEEMNQAFLNLKAKQGEIQAQMGRLREPVSDLRKQLSTYLEDNRKGPDPTAVSTLLAAAEAAEVEVRQIHIKEGDLVERCESCHMGIRSPVELSLQDVKGKKVFTSHNLNDRASAMVALHDPEQYGCTPCHNGNGVALASVDKAHGKYKHWLWPMFDKENVESGCVQCHGQDLFLEHAQGYGADATGFNKGKWLFKHRGCASCHRYEGMDQSSAHIKLVQQELDEIAESMKEVHRTIASNKAITENPDAPEEALEQAFAAIPEAEQRLHLLNEQWTAKSDQLEELDLEVKMTGPTLVDVRQKLKPEWIQPWLMDPQAFRPGTRMPQYRFSDEQAWSIAAYLWQAGDPEPMPEREEGDVERGEYLFKSRGCMACHQAYLDFEEDVLPYYPEGERSFAADLSRVGEKAHRDYLAAWVQDPKAQNKYTAMPSFRLTEEESNHIAAWLASRQNADARYAERDAALKILEDPRRVERGRTLIQHFGCSACHEVPGFEQAYVGVELTEEGSKPIERLDFGHYTHEAKRNHWYDHKGFFVRKLKNPAIWDDGKMVESEFDALKMPNPHLADHEIQAITTFLLGSVKSAVPEKLRFHPNEQQDAIQEGWWVIKKYNCQGCHQIRPEEFPILWTLPWYGQDGDLQGVPTKNGRPPTLVGEGTRVNPDWLSRFLDNPALTQNPDEWHRNGVRQGMMVRMPTYALSEGERMKLVNFFIAMSGVPGTYVKPAHDPLADDELRTARAVFVAADCANCHPLGIESLDQIDPATTYAPSFGPLSERIRRNWLFRWIAEPNTVIPGTAMPAKFKRDGERWVVDGIAPAALQRLTDEEKQLIEQWPGDHVELLQRYFGQWDHGEARFHKDKLTTTN